MFEPTPTPNQQPPLNPLNPVMPAPGMPSGQVPPMTPPPTPPPMTPQVHTMPERFRSSGSGSGPKGSSTTKKLMITLIVVIVVAGLGIGGLFVFNRFVKTNTNTTNENTNTTTNLNVNSAINTNTVSNSNTSTINENANTNTVANLNTNAATNVNTGTNVNATNTNTTTNTNSNTNTSVSLTPLPSSLDSDSDGLTNVEEAVFTTDTNNLDTDADTFLDGMKVQTDGTILGEVANLYNPKGAGNLEGTSVVKRVTNAGNTFSLLVPTGWTTNESSAILVITPTTQTGEFFQVRTYDNTSNAEPAAWYQTNVPQGGTPTAANFNGLATLRTADNSTIYFFKGTKVYGLSYTLTGLSQANYWTTMMMMLKSFKLVAAS